MDTTNAGATVAKPAGLTPIIDETDALLKQAVKNVGQEDLASLLGGAEAYLTGAPIDVELVAPTEALSISFKNELGHTYTGTIQYVNGKLKLKAQ